MPQKRNNDFKGKYPCFRAGTLEPMRIKDILTINQFGKELQTIMVVDTSLHSLSLSG